MSLLSSPLKPQSRGWAALRSPSAPLVRFTPSAQTPLKVTSAAFPDLSAEPSVHRDLPSTQAPVRKAVTPPPSTPIDWTTVKAAELAHNSSPSLSLLSSLPSSEKSEDDVTDARLPSILLKKKAKQLRDKSSKAYERGDHSLSRTLSSEAAALDSEAHSLQCDAAKTIFLAKNSSRGVDQIDLHGLFAEEALERLEMRLRLIAEKLDRVLPSFKLEVITGWGKGQSGRAILRPAVEAWLRENAFHFVEKFPGHFFVVVRRNSFEAA